MTSEIARAYARFAHAAEGSPEYEANLWSFDSLLTSSMTDPERAWAMIKSVVDYDASPKVLETVAAGPVEEMLVHHGRKMIDVIEQDAKENARLRELLGGVWQGDMDIGVWARIEAIRSRKW